MTRTAPELSRRDFVTGASLAAGATLWPGPVPASRSPLSSADGTVVLFQGDSITDSGRNRTIPDANAPAALGSGYPFLVAAAALAAYPERALRFYNRGISGNKVPDLQQRWVEDALALKPDVLSILIGVNDFWHKLGPQRYSGTVEDYERQYVALLDQTRAALPQVQLIMLEPFVLRCGAVDDRWFPEFDQRRAVAARVAEHARATFVPLQKVFDDLSLRANPAYWAADGVHPTPAGHAVIAERWRRAANL